MQVIAQNSIREPSNRVSKSESGGPVETQCARPNGDVGWASGDAIPVSCFIDVSSQIIRIDS